MHNPKDTLTILRWAQGRWVVDGQLDSDHYQGFWDFPENDLRAHNVVAASSEAPVFDGAEGGAGGYGLMVAVRQDQKWSWARFVGCPLPGRCPPLITRPNTAANARVVRGHLTGELGNCHPDCAASRIVYVNHFSWDTRRNVFILTRQDKVRVGRHHG